MFLERAIVHFFDRNGTSFEACQLELDRVRVVLDDCVLLTDLTPLQIIEWAIAQFINIAPVSFVAPQIDSPGKVREQEKILQKFVESTRRQFKQGSSSGHRNIKPKL